MRNQQHRQGRNSGKASYVARSRFSLNPDGTSRTPVKTYILFGQSNAAGLGEYTDLPAALQGPQAGSYITNGLASSLQPRSCFEEMIPGFNTAPNPTVALNYPFTTYANMNGNSRHGLEVTLSDSLKAKYGEDIYCIKLAAGGTPLNDDPNSDDWSVSSGELLNGLKNDALPAAVKCLCDQGFYPEWLGAVWVQGEADRSRGTLPDVYQEHERLLVSCLRQEVGLAFMPFVSFLLPPFAANNTDVNAAKTANDGAIQGYTALPGGTTDIGDSVHYDSSALQAMGVAASAIL